MTLVKKPYKALDALRLIFEAAPFFSALNMLITLVAALFSTALMALATANFVDTALAVLQGKQPHDNIYLPLILLLVVLGIMTTIRDLNNLCSARIGLNLQRKLKSAVVRIHAGLDFKHIENAESWELISRVSRDPVKSIMDGTGAFVLMIQIVVSIATVLGLIVAHVWWAAVIIVAFSAPMIWLSLRAGKKNYQANRDAEKFNRRNEYLDEVLCGRESIDERTLFGYGDDLIRRWEEQFEAGRRLQLKVSLKYFLITKGSSLCLALISLLIALTLIGPVVSGQMSAGMFMGIISAVFGMVQMLGWQVSWATENITKLGEYMKDLSAFINLSEAKDGLSEPDAEPMEFSSLEFRNVRFKYPSGENHILDGLSFILEGGRHYAFVGRNGAGKTTITKLLTGLYTEYEGEILINGKELREYPAGTLKAMFSVVYQDFAKYYIPLKDNIALGDAAKMGHDGERILQAATQAGLGETINELKDGIDTWLGKIKENGQDISGGQWQRVAIARSLMSRAPMKMLDEPTASLDPISESRVYENFEMLMKGKTTVFISHRLGSTKLADEILVIDKGRIVEQGTHMQLMELNGEYAKMFEAQKEWYQ